MNPKEEQQQESLRKFIAAEINRQLSVFVDQLRNEISQMIDDAIDQKVFKRRAVVDVWLQNGEKIDAANFDDLRKFNPTTVECVQKTLEVFAKNTVNGGMENVLASCGNDLVELR